jgi:hypothetical protein
MVVLRKTVPYPHPHPQFRNKLSLFPLRQGKVCSHHHKMGSETLTACHGSLAFSNLISLRLSGCRTGRGFGLLH